MYSNGTTGHGTHIVSGERGHNEGATFWMLAADKGLALIAAVDKGDAPIIAERRDWYMNDCVEVFTDTANRGKKPSKQIFLAYRRPGTDRARASNALIRIGRMKTTTGYLLETLIPWRALGFDALPAAAFGLELQVDFAAQGRGRVLQMGFGTATNEAWINAKHYLKAVVREKSVVRKSHAPNR